MVRFHRARFWQGVALILAMLAISACDTVTVTTGAGTSGTSTSSSLTPGTTTTVPPTPTPVPTCASLLPGGHDISTGSAPFSDITYPTGAIADGITQHAGGTGLWTTYYQHVCVTATTADAIRAFYTAQLPVTGWSKSPTMPFDGGYQAACGDPYCWLKGHEPRYIGLEQVTTVGNLVTYRLRLLVPPSPPVCAGYPPGISPPPGVYSSFYTTDGQSVPLPPLTQDEGQEGYADPGGSPQHLSVFLCSAGTAASVSQFMHNELPGHGWVTGSGPCTHTTTLYKGKVEVGLLAASDPTQWQINVTTC